MKIVYIKTAEQIEKTKRELEQEKRKSNNASEILWVDKYKTVPLKEPVYIVEMSMKELQLVSFYLELEKRKPIVNVKLETKLKQENKDD